MTSNNPQDPNFTQGPTPVDPSAGYQTTPNYGPAPTGQPGYPAPGAPNPMVAAVLGLIPGVGAMYNGQYAKGVVHLIVFAVLVSLADQNGIFGLFVAGWIFYQAFEAHHTAKARRDGQPLPNPFGLNDIGERFGFGKSWPNYGPSSNVPPVQPGAPWTTPQQPTTYPGTDPAAGWSANTYVPPTGAYQSAPYMPPQSAATPNPIPGPTPHGMGGDPNWGAPTDSYAGNPYTAPVAPAPDSRIPVGAIVMIGLGVLFLLGNEGLFHSVFNRFLIPVVVIAFGLWVFYRKLSSTGGSVQNDGSPQYNYRIFQASRGAVWIVLTGMLFLLDTCNVLDWSRSWPLYIILAGVMTVYQRHALRQAFGPNGYAPPPYGAAPGQPYGQPYPGPIVTPPPATTTVVQLDPITGEPMPPARDQEGR